MKREVKSYNQFINEATKNVVYPTNFQGMVQSALAGLYSSVMAIAQELANEKAARNPQRYDGTVADVDITRAMNMIFHSDWKKQMKKKALGQMVNKSMERAGKQDKVINQKNIRAIGRMLGDKDFQMDIDKSSARFSDSKGNGRGSNQ
jgi:predicted HNH restriction endonuclease